MGPDRTFTFIRVWIFTLCVFIYAHIHNIYRYVCVWYLSISLSLSIYIHTLRQICRVRFSINELWMESVILQQHLWLSVDCVFCLIGCTCFVSLSLLSLYICVYIDTLDSPYTYWNEYCIFWGTGLKWGSHCFARVLKRAGLIVLGCKYWSEKLQGS